MKKKRNKNEKTKVLGDSCITCISLKKRIKDQANLLLFQNICLYFKALYETTSIDFLCYMKTFSDGMVIDFFVTSRPSVRQWSSIFFTMRLSLIEWSLIFLSHWGLLRGNVHWFSYVTLRPSPMKWSLISLSYWGPLRGNSHQIFLHEYPLWWNNHWFCSVCISALSTRSQTCFLASGHSHDHDLLRGIICFN